MGLLSIRQADRDLAANDCFLDLAIAVGTFTPIELLDHTMTRARSYRVAIVKKPSTSLVLSKFATTLYTQIRVPHGFGDWGTASKAILLAHELVHVRQWRSMRARNFGARYIFSPRFRWSMEMQAYRETVRAQLLMGWTETAVANAIEQRADKLFADYSLRTIRRNHVERYTRAVLYAELRSRLHEK